MPWHISQNIVMTHNKTTSSRRLATINELSSYFGVHRNTMRKWKAVYGIVDLRDLYSILDFVIYIMKNKDFKEKL